MKKRDTFGYFIQFSYNLIYFNLLTWNFTNKLFKYLRENESITATAAIFLIEIFTSYFIILIETYV